MAMSLQLVMALAVDRLIGDPRWPGHPVVLIGNLIAWLEKALRRETDGAARKKWCGALLVVTVLALVYGVTAILLYGLALVHPGISWCAGALLLAFAISPRSLAEAGQEIRDLMRQDNLEQARVKVGWIVGRDTENLSTGEVSRATVETVAENTSDGVIAPLFYAMIGGAPLAMTYKMVNTMDSMLGYLNEKYRDIGYFPAKTDDAWNVVPARLTGVLMLLGSLFRFDVKNGWRVMRRDRRNHKSPNCGYPESAAAGLLGVRLGGENVYFGERVWKPTIGDATRPLERADIARAVEIMFRAGIVGMALYAAAARLG